MATCKFQKCKAECCRYVSVPMKTPRSKDDFDEIKWYVAHKNVTVYKDHDKNWFAEFITPCECLDEKTFECRIYDTKPAICTSYSPDICTTNVKGDPHKFRFYSPADVDKYTKKRWMK